MQQEVLSSGIDLPGQNYRPLAIIFSTVLAGIPSQQEGNTTQDCGLHSSKKMKNYLSSCLIQALIASSNNKDSQIRKKAILIFKVPFNSVKTT